jgi:hypothetical protein
VTRILNVSSSRKWNLSRTCCIILEACLLFADMKTRSTFFELEEIVIVVPYVMDLRYVFQPVNKVISSLNSTETFCFI